MKISKSLHVRRFAQPRANAPPFANNAREGYLNRVFLGQEATWLARLTSAAAWVG